MSKREIPRITGYADGPISIWVCCPFCGCLHTHGRGTRGNPVPGHRLSHCVDMQALSNGYEIVEVRPFEELKAAHPMLWRKLQRERREAMVDMD